MYLIKGGRGFFTQAVSDRTRSNGFKLKESRFILYVRKKFFTQRVVNHWCRLPREVDVPSLEMFKTNLDRDLNNLIY